MKKLSLNKETIATLNGIQMAGFNGGANDPLTTERSKCDTICPTDCLQTWCNTCYDTCGTNCAYYTCDPTCTTWDSSCC